MNKEKYPLTVKLVGSRVSQMVGEGLLQELSDIEIFGVVVALVCGTAESPRNKAAFEELKIQGHFDTAADSLCQAVEALLKDGQEITKQQTEKLKNFIDEVSRIFDETYPPPPTPPPPSTS